MRILSIILAVLLFCSNADAGVLTRNFSLFMGGTGGNDEYTMLLLPMDGTDGSISFPDSSFGGVNSPHTVTAAGNAQVDTAIAEPWGTNNGVGLFDGTGDYLSIPDSADFTFTSDFTIDFWAYVSSSFPSANPYLIHSLNGISDVAIQYRNSDTPDHLSFIIDGVQTDCTAPSLNAWHHIALVRSGGINTLYSDGVALGSIADSDTLIMTSIHIGSNVNPVSNNFNGKLDEFRVSKGIAREIKVQSYPYD